MATSAEDFERAWGSYVRGGAEPARPELRELVAVGEGLRSFQMAVHPPSADLAWARLSEGIDHEVGVTGAVVVPLRRMPRRRLVLRLGTAAVAVFALLATVSLRATPGSFLYPLRTGLEETALLIAPNNGPLHLHVAEARLGDLVHALRDGPQAAAPGLARALVAQRSAAKAHGASVVALDADVRSEVPPGLAVAPAGIAGQVRTILGGLLPPVAPEVGQTHEGSDGGDTGSGDGAENSGSGSNSGDGSHETGSSEGGSGSGDQGSGNSSGSGSGDSGGAGSGDQTGGSASGSGGGDTSGDGGWATADGGSGSDSQDSGSNTSGEGGSGSADDGSGGSSTD
jgi:hypothetical protein